MKIIICNAFSLSMLDRDNQRVSAKDPLSRARTPSPVDFPDEWLDEWENRAEIVSAVGHEDTAAVFTGILGRPVPFNRVNVKVADDTILLVGQYIGPRLPTGATTLPEGAVIEWWSV